MERATIAITVEEIVAQCTEVVVLSEKQLD